MGLNPEYNTIQSIEKFREGMAEKLRLKYADGVAWAKRIGLKHWHAVGWGCHKNCLEGVGEAIDHDRIRTRRGKFVHPAQGKFPHKLAQQKSIATRTSKARLRREGIE